MEGLRGDAPPMLEWRVLGTGSEGSGPVGGAIEGREGRGSVVLDMLTGPSGEWGTARTSRVGRARVQ